jgi:hypothetical protein
MDIDEVTSHLQHEHRQRQHEPDPEPPRHIDELGVGPCVGGCHCRFESHAADRARAGTRLPDLRVHRTGIDCAFGDGLRSRSLALEITRRLGSKFGPAARGTEVIAAVLVLVMTRCRRWVAQTGSVSDLSATDAVEPQLARIGCWLASCRLSRSADASAGFWSTSTTSPSLDGGSIKFRRQRA